MCLQVPQTEIPTPQRPQPLPMRLYVFLKSYLILHFIFPPHSLLRRRTMVYSHHYNNSIFVYKSQLFHTQLKIRKSFNKELYSDRPELKKHIEIVNAVWYNQNCKHRIFSTKARNTFEKQTPPQIADTFACDAVFYHRNSYRYYRYVLQFKEHLSTSQK